MGGGTPLLVEAFSFVPQYRKLLAYHHTIVNCLQYVRAYSRGKQ